MLLTVMQTRSLLCCHDNITVLITPVLSQPHWLPLRLCVDFKVATFIHQSLSGILRSYLSDDCRFVCDDSRMYERCIFTVTDQSHQEMCRTLASQEALHTTVVLSGRRWQASMQRDDGERSQEDGVERSRDPRPHSHFTTEVVHLS